MYRVRKESLPITAPLVSKALITVLAFIIPLYISSHSLTTYPVVVRLGEKSLMPCQSLLPSESGATLSDLTSPSHRA